MPNPWEKYQTSNPWEKYSQVEEVQPKETGNAGGALSAGVYGFNEAVPFGGKLTSALAAGAVAPFVDETYPELYKQAQENALATQQAHPIASVVGNLAGIGATIPMASTKAITALGNVGKVRGAVNAIPKAIQGIGEFANTGNLAARAAKGAITAAPVGALYGAGQSENELEGAKSGALLAGAVGAGLPAVGALLGGSARAVGKIRKGVDLTGAKKLESLSKEKYAQLEKSGEVVPYEQFSDKLIKAAESLKPKSITTSGKLTKEQISLSNEIDDVIGTLGKNESVGLGGIEELYQTIGNKIDKYVQPNGKISKEGYELSRLQDSLLDIVEEIPATKLNKDARELWKASRKMTEINKIIERANMTDNPATSMKTGFRNLYLNGKRMRGFDREETKLIKNAAEGNVVADSLRTLLGSRLNYLAGLAGGGLPGAVVGGLTSGIARGGANALMSAKAAKILERIGNGTLDKVSEKELMSLKPQEAQHVFEVIKRQSSKAPLFVEVRPRGKK